MNSANISDELLRIIDDLQKRVEALETIEDAPSSLAHDILSATHTDTIASAVTRGALVVGNATPKFDDLAIGTAQQLLTVNAAGTDPVWKSFDWDDINDAAGVDMVHSHATGAEGGQLDWDNIWSDAVHSHASAAEGGVLPQDTVEVSKLVASDGAPDPSLSADASGYLTAAVQPLFSAYNSVTDADVTGDGTVYTVVPDTEIGDRNSNYNNATGIFTAPVTGNYIFCFGIYLQQLTANHNNYQVRLITSNRTYIPVNYLYGAGANPCTEVILSASVTADMDAGDTAYLAAYVGGSNKTVDVGGNAALVLTYLQGYLLI